MNFLKGLSGICSIYNDVCSITIALYHHAIMPISIIFYLEKMDLILSSLFNYKKFTNATNWNLRIRKIDYV